MTRFCKHNYVFTQGYFYCTKCSHRSYGRSRKKKQAKKAAIGISIILLVGIIGFLFVNDVFEINEKNLKDAIQNIPITIPDEIQIPIKEKTDEITTNINKQIDSIKNEPQMDRIISQIPKVEPPKQFTIGELQQIALDDINEYRKDGGLRSLPLGSAKSPQLYAEELLPEGCIHHVSDDGEGPMLRYKNNNDQMFLIWENIGGGLGTYWETPDESIINSNYRMMFDDADSNWGHKDNILNPNHRSVSIGIAYDNQHLVMVQDFEQALQSGYQYDPSSFMKEPVDHRLCW